MYESSYISINLHQEIGDEAFGLEELEKRTPNQCIKH